MPSNGAGWTRALCPCAVAVESLMLLGNHMRRSRMRAQICASAIICLVAVTTPAPAQKQTAIPVGALAAERRPVTRASEFVGRVEAIGRVEIRARVTGFLEDV